MYGYGNKTKYLEVQKDRKKEEWRVMSKRKKRTGM